ncbi:Alpha-defensin 14 (Fragment) [Lemmus lemmus]
MKTLALLSVLALLAFLAQADPLPEATEETKNEVQPGVEDQDVSISFGGPEGSALQDAVKRDLICYLDSHSPESSMVIEGKATSVLLMAAWGLTGFRETYGLGVCRKTSLPWFGQP